MNNPKISVIIPVYNIEPYLSRCLDSVINQTYKNLEIIVINDGSTDKSGEIADSYCLIDNRVIVIHKTNNGVSAARNAGIDKATGEYIGFVDGDDYIEPDMYELLIQNAIYNSADISHCGYKMVFPNRIDLYYGTGKILLLNKNEGLIELLKGEIIEPGLCNKIYKRELFLSIRFREDIRNHEDLLANYYLFNLSEKSIFKDETKYHYMVRKNSAATSSININKVKGPIDVSLDIEKHAKSNSIIYPFALKRCILSHITTYNIIVRNGIKSFSLESENIKQTLKELFNKIKETRILSIKYKVITFMIIYFSFVYNLIYSLYCCFSNTKNKYKVD